MILVKALRARYCQGFETKVWSWFWSIFLLKTLRLNFGNFFEVEVWSRPWGRCLVEILMLRYSWDFDQLVLWLTKILWWENSTPGSVGSLAMFIIYFSLSHPIPSWSIPDYTRGGYRLTKVNFVHIYPQIPLLWSKIRFLV